jgi:hypothetical protein
MKCPNCQYELTESERLLCSVPGGHYCPRCWTRISQGNEAAPATIGPGTDAEKPVGDSPPEGQ